MGIWSELRSYRGLFDSRVWYLTYGQVFQSLGRGVLMPFMTLYFYNVQGFPLILVGTAFAIAFPTGALFGLVWGALADRYGRKPLMLVGFGAHALTTASLAFVETVPQFFVAMTLNSIATSAWVPASRAMIADVTTPARRTRAYGLTYMANNLGLSVGLLAGGALAILLPYRALFFIEALGTAAYFLVILVFVRESFPQRAHDVAPGAAASPLRRVARHVHDIGTPLRDRRFLVYSLVILLIGMGYGQFYITFSPWMANVIGSGDTWIAIIFAINTVMVILLQIPIAHWAERRRRTAIFAYGAYLQATSLLLTWAAGRIGGLDGALALMVGATILLTLQEIALAPAMPALVASLAGRPERVGKYMAGMELLFAINTGASSVIGGAFFDAGRPHLLWPTMMALSLLALPAIWWLSRLLPDDVNEPGGEEPPGSAPQSPAPPFPAAPAAAVIDVDGGKA